MRGRDPVGARPLGEEIKAPLCTICHERSGYKLGMSMEEQTPFICATCRRIQYVMDRLRDLLKELWH